MIARLAFALLCGDLAAVPILVALYRGERARYRRQFRQADTGAVLQRRRPDRHHAGERG